MQEVNVHNSTNKQILSADDEHVIWSNTQQECERL